MFAPTLRLTLRGRRVRWHLAIGCCFALFAGIDSAPAQMPKSLEFVPADAAFYSASLRGKEQFELVINSRAFAKLKEMPAVQMGWAMLQQQWNDPQGDLAEVRAMLDQPENQRLVKLLLDAMSHEVFMFGDEGFADLIEVANEMNQANQSAQFAAITGNQDAASEMVRTRMRAILLKHLETFEVPEGVIGFRISDPEMARAQVARLEQALGDLLDAEKPDWRDRLSREKIGGSEFLTLKLDGSLVPWDELELDLPEDAQQKIKKLTLSISLGMREEYLIVSVGDSNEHLTRLGQGPLLSQRKELEPLQKHARQRVTSVGYASETFLRRINGAPQQIDQLVELVEGFIPLAQLESSVEQELMKDIRALGAELKAAIPEAGAMSGISFLTARGMEGYSYSWAEHETWDGSQPLTILEHVGGDAIMVLAGRRRYSPESVERLSHWCGRVFHHAEAIGVERLGAAEREFYDKVRDKVVDLLRQAEQVWLAKWAPAFKDGQGAIVLDAKSTSERWHEQLPPSSQSLPMLELALVYGINDANSVREAAGEYLKIAQQVVDTLHEAEPQKIPELDLPAPESRDFPGGTVYYYRLPLQAGLDKQISPNAGLSEDTLVLSLIPKMTVRLLERTPLQNDASFISRDQNAAGVFQLNFAALLDAVRPWVSYGIEQAGVGAGNDLESQIETGLDIAQCFRAITAVTYRERDTWVTHYEVHVQDLPE